MGRLLAGTNTSFHSIYYYFNLVSNYFNLVSNDPDDNKFVDTYLAANADYLVTNDTKVLQLNNLAFPPITAISLQTFAAMW